MAMMIPYNIIKGSNAEKKVFKMLRGLPDEYIVIYSYPLKDHNNKVEGEIDFVIICKKGVLCLEVKGGRVYRKNHVWHVIDRNNNDNIIESPFMQARGNMYSLLEYFKKYAEGNIKDCNIYKVLFAYGVIIPDERFEVKGEDNDINKKLLINTENIKKQDFNIKELIDKMFEQAKEKCEDNNYMKQDLEEHMIQAIKEFFIKDAGYVKSLSADLEEAQQALVRLTEEQKDVLDKMIENDRVIIKGTCGTGKTILLYEQTIRLAKEEKKVIFICYNRSLSQYLNNMLKKENQQVKENVEILTLHKYMENELNKISKYTSKEKRKDKKNYFNKKLPNDFIKIDNESYDVMVIDEAQDILNYTYFNCLNKIVKGGLKNGKWYMCLDENQNVYNNTEFEDLLNSIKSEIRPATAKLTKNCRNTKQISEFNFKFTNIEQSRNEEVHGEKVQELTYKYNNEQKDKVINIIKDLKKAGIKNSEITILSEKSYKESIFRGENFLKDLSTKIEMVGEENNSEQDTKDFIKFATIRKFKGLESKVIILCDVNKTKDNESRSLNYVAISRAKALLYVLCYSIDNEFIDEILGIKVIY